MPASMGSLPAGGGGGGGGVAGTVKGGRQKWVIFGTAEPLYEVAAHLCIAIKATATAQWQKATRGGWRKPPSKPPPPTRADEAAR